MRLRVLIFAGRDISPMEIFCALWYTGGMKRISIPPELKKVNAVFERHGFCAYLVGGAVRDTLLGRPVSDWDIATGATPEQVMGMFRKVVPTGIAHGTVTVHVFGKQIETTTFRTESSYSDGRHPDTVRYAASIEEDLSRRDFTMNAIAAELGTGVLVDPFGGQKDIGQGVIRTVGNPLERFAEDGLRPVRAIRFMGQLGFTIEKDTLDAISHPDVLSKTASVSVERFRDEWCKLLQSERPSHALRLLERTGILSLFIPEFSVCRGCTQADARGFHEFDVADHILYAVDGAPKQNLHVRLAAFYHDIGKPECRTTECVNGRTLIHFHRHEAASEKKCRDSMRRLKFPNSDIQKVAHLVSEHMFHYESAWSDAAVRRFIVRVGGDQFEDLLALRLSDIYGMHNRPLAEGSPSWNLLAELKKRVISVIDARAALSIKDLAVNGSDLIALGIPEGKTLGLILRELFDTVTESPAMNTRKALLTLAKNCYEQKYAMPL